MSADEKYILDPCNWVERYGDYLFNYAVVRVSDHAKAEDLVQDTFLAGLKVMKDFQGKSTERTWLISILKRKIIDTYRKKYASKESSMSAYEKDISDGDLFRSNGSFKGHWIEGKGPHSHSIFPDGKVENEELMQMIALCIAQLPPNLGAAFIMRMIDESEAEEICKKLGITTSNLWVMLHRARLKMRICLESNWLNK